MPPESQAMTEGERAITVRRLARDDFEAVVALRVAPGQESYGASNLRSIAEAYFELALIPLAIVAHGQIVGFALIGPEDDPARWWIGRFMIGVDHQGQG